MWEDKRLVIVEWNDAACEGSWQSHGTIFTPVKVWSIGLVQQDDEDVIALAGTTTETGDINQIIVIPKGMVVSVEDISK
jgi:hypothetical protein